MRVCRALAARATSSARESSGCSWGSGAPIGARGRPILARLQRVSADYVNYQKRVQRDIDAARSFANESLIKALLAVLDDVERALEAGRAGHDENDPLLSGMELVHDKALETLDRFGLTAIEAEGKPFDPEIHSAMMQQPSDVHPPQTVATSFETVFGAHQERQAIVLMAQGAAMARVAAARGGGIVVVEQARAYAFERPQVEKARSLRFLEQLESYDKGGTVYLMREYFSILDTLVPQMRKYVTATEAVGRSIYEINLEDKLTPELFSGFGFGMDNQESDK